MSQVDFLATLYAIVVSVLMCFPWEGPVPGLVCFSNNVSFKRDSIYFLSYFKS